MLSGDARHLTDRQALALIFAGMIEEVSVAEVRRRAISEAADRYLAVPNIAECVRLAMLHRAKEGIGRPPLRSVDNVSTASQRPV